MVISVLSIVVLVLITMLVLLLFKFSFHIYKINIVLTETCKDLSKYYDTFVKLYDKYRAAESNADKTEAVKKYT